MLVLGSHSRPGVTVTVTVGSGYSRCGSHTEAEVVVVMVTVTIASVRLEVCGGLVQVGRHYHGGWEVGQAVLATRESYHSYKNYESHTKDSYLSSLKLCIDECSLPQAWLILAKTGVSL